jgi:protein TonB
MAIRSSTLFTASFVFHGAMWIVSGGLEAKSQRAPTAIQVTEVKKKKPPEPAKVEPQQPPKQKAKPKLQKTANPEPLPELEALPKAPLEALPDFGLTLSGGVGGDGIAIPAGGPIAAKTTAQKAAPERVVKRTLSPVGAASPAGDACEDPPTKPKPVSVPQPAVTEAARAAGVEGKVRVELTVDETGRVVEVRVLQGLGYGLDEAALAAARSATFEPALRCGKPTRATFTISMRFTAA